MSLLSIPTAPINREEIVAQHKAQQNAQAGGGTRTGRRSPHRAPQRRPDHVDAHQRRSTAVERRSAVTADRHLAGRPLPHQAPVRRGRHGPGLRGRARRDRPAGGGEGPAPRLQPHARGGRAVPARGAGGVEGRSPEHRRRHRLRHHRRRLVLLRDGVPRGGRAGAGDLQGAVPQRPSGPCTSAPRCATPCRRPTTPGSSTAISSPRTSS